MAESLGAGVKKRADVVGSFSSVCQRQETRRSTVICSTTTPADLVKIHPGKGHWMDREDAVAIPWMAKWNRNPVPTRIVWKQDDVVENRFYWLAIEPKEIRDRAEIVATRTKNTIEIQTKDADRIAIRLNDEMMDLDLPISIRCGDVSVFHGMVPRSIGNIAKTLSERGDPKSIFCAEVTVAISMEQP